MGANRFSILLTTLSLSLLILISRAIASTNPYITDHQVNFGTGNKYYTATDVNILAPGPQISFKRVYNSQSTEDSIMGYGWTAMLVEKLLIDTSEITLVLPGNRYVSFTDNGNGQWTSELNPKWIITVAEEGYELLEKGGSKKLFNNNGVLFSKIDRNNNSISYGYDGDNLIHISNNFGQSISLAYTDGKLSSVTSALGTETYGYENDNLTLVTKHDQTFIEYKYEDPNDPHNLTGIIDEERVQILTVEYDIQDRVIRSAKANGENEIEIAYLTADTREVTRSGTGATTTYNLDVLYGIAKVGSFNGPSCSSCGSGNNMSYTYNDLLQVIEETDGNGVVTGYSYDEDGNRDGITKAVGTSYETQITKDYVRGSNRVQTITKNSVSNTDQYQVTSFEYYSNGNLWKKIETGYRDTTQLNRITTYSYDTYGRVETIDGQRTDVNDISTYSYYMNDPVEGANRGHLRTVTNAKGHVITYSNYNVFGKAERIEDSNNVVTILDYYPNGLLKTRITAGSTTSYSYNAAGALQTVQMPGGRIVNYNYNLAGYIDSITDNLGNAITYSYDAEGRKIAQIINDPEGKLTAYINYEYDENGRLSKILNPDDTFKEFLYDGVGNLINQLDEKQHLTEYLYDPLNRLTDTIQPTGVTTSITYDLHGNQTSVTDGNGNVTTFTYDDFGNRLSRTSLDTGTTYYSYDSAGNLASKTNANNITITYQYDVLNRVIAVYYPDSSHNVVYGYDEGAYGVGRLTSVQDGVSTTSYAYDQLGNLIRQEKQIGEALFVTEYKYNESNELISIVYPSGRNVDYVRNALGQVTSIDSSYNGESTSIVHDVSRLPFGPIQSMTLGNGAAWNSSYDERYRLSSVSVGDFYSRQYGYLATGQVETITDVLNNQNSQQFTYDELGRLVTALGGYGQYSYNYDAVGNRLDKSYGDQTDTYVYQTGSNRLLEVNSSATTNFSYDEAGNTVAKGDQHYSWTQDNRLGSVEVNAETVGQYGYDANGLRVIKNSEGVNRLAIYDAGGNLLAETTEGGEVIREYVYLDGQRITLFDYTVQPQFTLQVATSEGIAVSNAKAYAFTEQNSYAGIYGTTDEAGNSLFDRTDFVQEMYTFRVDYLGASFWSEPVNVQQADTIIILIEDEPTEVQVVLDGAAQEGVKVYAFTEAGSYLGVYGVTDGTGTVKFTLPEGENYLFRADLLGGHYWSSSTTIQAGGIPAVINTGGGELQFFVGQDADTPLEGLKTYLFAETGSYLGQTSVTTADGLICYTVPSGTYKVRVDYLGYQFWSEPIAITSDGTGEILIPHSPVTFTATAAFNGTQTPLAEVPCYLFTPAKSYLQLNGVTDGNGQIVFNLPEKAYKVRADYLSQQYWSKEITAEDDTIAVPFGSASVQVTKMGLPVSDIAVYVFDAAGSYLNISGYTDADGVVMFDLPAGDYRFRADYQGSQYWGDDLALVASQDNPIEISTGGGSFVLALTDQDENPIEGIKTYVFTENGTYLGESALTDGQGQVGFNLADGTYKLRIDYLGYQYWTAPFGVPATASLEQVIPHQDVVLTAQTDFAGEVMPVAGARAYLFTPSGTYMNISGTADATGAVVFRLPPQEYAVRVDYLGRQYWSEVLNQSDATVTIPEGQARVALQSGSEPLAGVKVYVFSESDSYLNISGTTDAEGGATFALPEGVYKFRADYQSAQFWASGGVVTDLTSDIQLQTGGGTLAVTVRVDGTSVISGVKCYLFSAGGAYLGQSATTDANGLVTFDVADGSYKIRLDYLGYQYWSDALNSSEILSTAVTIPHEEVGVAVTGSNAASVDQLAGVRCYLFTAAGSYTGITTVSDELGVAHFNVPLNLYKVRADYMGEKYWSEEFDWFDTTIDIPHGDIALTVTEDNYPVSGATVYLFTEAGSYLSINGTTDENGKVVFSVPASSYKLRADVNGGKFWSEVVNVLEYQENTADIAIENSAAIGINNPRPARYDGEPPLYMPMVASLTLPGGILAQSTAEISLGSDARPFWFIADHLGTAQIVTDVDGNVVWQGEYRPFGEVEVVVDELENLFRFPGQVLDVESGLYYNWHRFYDPTTGRYISADPIGLAGGMNLYGYVKGDPANWVDLMGLRTATNQYKTPERGQHGYWCGPDWTGGYERKSWDELTDSERRNAILPIDGMDSCCQDHDRCYGRCREEYPCDEEARADCFRLCDRTLASCANKNRTGFYFFDRVMTEYFKDSMPKPGPSSPTCSSNNKP